MTIDEAIKVAEEGATLPTVMSPPYDIATVLALLRFVRAWDESALTIGAYDGDVGVRRKILTARAAIDEALK